MCTRVVWLIVFGLAGSVLGFVIPAEAAPRANRTLQVVTQPRHGRLNERVRDSRDLASISATLQPSTALEAIETSQFASLEVLAAPTETTAPAASPTSSLSSPADQTGAAATLPTPATVQSNTTAAASTPPPLIESIPQPPSSTAPATIEPTVREIIREISRQTTIEQPIIQQITHKQLLTVTASDELLVTTDSDGSVKLTLQPDKLTGLNAVALTSGTLAAARLPSAVSLLGQTIEPTELTGKLGYQQLDLTGMITSNDIAAAAAIPYSKLNLTGSITTTDLATGTTIPYSTLNLANSITNADISTTAAIHYSKLDLTGYSFPLTDGVVTDGKLTEGYLKLGNGISRGDKLYLTSVSFDTSYPTGGELLNLSAVIGGTIRAVVVPGVQAGYGFEIDPALFTSRQFKLKAIKLSNGNEANNNTNLTAIGTVSLLIIAP